MFSIDYVGIWGYTYKPIVLCILLKLQLFAGKHYTYIVAV